MASIKKDNNQTCALLEKAINDNFKNLFNQRPELAEVYYDDQRSRGAVMKAMLLPPKFKLHIGSGDMPELLFEFGVHSGTVMWGKERMQNIDQWIITFKASIAEVTVSPDPNHDEEQAEDAAIQWEEIEKSFPEKLRNLRMDGYSAQRLFVPICSTRSATLVEDLSYLPNPKPDRGNSKEMFNFNEWAIMAGPRAQMISSDVVNLIRGWAQDNKESALFTLGVRVRLPNGKDEVNIPNEYEQLATWGHGK